MRGGAARSAATQPSISKQELKPKAQQFLSMITVAVHLKDKLSETDAQKVVKRVSDCMRETGLAFETQFFLYNEETMRIGVVPGKSAFMDRFPQA
jgi:hypothetical protein